jgi:cytidylate kinase
MNSVIVVAIDGPAGSGKSSVSKAVATQLGFSYYDTGAAYRALAWAARAAGIDVSDEAAVVAIHHAMSYVASEDPTNQFFHVDGTDVTQAIRGSDVSGTVSAIAQHPQVRKDLVEHFRTVIAQCANPGIIMEGRDITTVVAPDADVRVLLTAAEEVRIQRREAEMGGTISAPIAQALKDRDRKDQTVVDFMNAAPGVSVLDSGPLNLEETVEAMLEIIHNQTGLTSAR